MSEKLQPSPQNNQNTLSRKTLSYQVKEYIKNAIMNGTYQAGDRIVEMTLARELGVSQATIREGIHELVMMGFLESEPNKGTTVHTFTSHELHEVYSVRASLESLAGRQATERITDADLAKLRTILDEMTEAARQNDAPTVVQKDNLFHSTILEISGNRLLCKLYSTFQFADWTIITILRLNQNLMTLAQRHETLFNALATRDPDIASAEMRDHIESLELPSELMKEDTVINFNMTHAEQ